MCSIVFVNYSSRPNIENLNIPFLGPDASESTVVEKSAREAVSCVYCSLKSTSPGVPELSLVGMRRMADELSISFFLFFLSLSFSLTFAELCDRVSKTFPSSLKHTLRTAARCPAFSSLNRIVDSSIELRSHPCDRVHKLCQRLLLRMTALSTTALSLDEQPSFL